MEVEEASLDLATNTNMNETEKEKEARAIQTTLAIQLIKKNRKIDALNSLLKAKRKKARYWEICYNRVLIKSNTQVREFNMALDILKSSNKKLEMQNKDIMQIEKPKLEDALLESEQKMDRLNQEFQQEKEKVIKLQELLKESQDELKFASSNQKPSIKNLGSSFKRHRSRKRKCTKKLLAAVSRAVAMQREAEIKLYTSSTQTENKSSRDGAKVNQE